MKGAEIAGGIIRAQSIDIAVSKEAYVDGDKTDNKVELFVVITIADSASRIVIKATGCEGIRELCDALYKTDRTNQWVIPPLVLHGEQVLLDAAYKVEQILESAARHRKLMLMPDIPEATTKELGYVTYEALEAFKSITTTVEEVKKWIR